LSVSHSGRFTHRNRAQGTNWTGSCMGYKADIDTLDMRKPFLPLPRIEPQFLGCRSCSLFTIPAELSRIVNRSGRGIILGSVLSRKSLGRTAENSKKSSTYNQSKVLMRRTERNCSLHNLCSVDPSCKCPHLTKTSTISEIVLMRTIP
jgi:hypothetical protein